jgi:hypothetical protein
MSHDPIVYEILGCDGPTEMPGRTAISPLEDPLFEFRRSDGTAELWAAQLEARHLAEELLGTETFSKRIREGLIDLTPVTIRQPIDTNTFRQEPLPTPSEMDENPVDLCTCSCPECRSRKCKGCSAATKCKFSRCEDAEKTVAAMVGELRGRIYPRGRNVSKATWQGLEAAMLHFVRSAIASAV